jgi:hypothetical protein
MGFPHLSVCLPHVVPSPTEARVQQMSVAATWTGAGDAGNWAWRVNWMKVGDSSNMNQQLTGAKRRVAGWVAGGCWDDENY